MDYENRVGRKVNSVNREKEFHERDSEVQCLKPRPGLYIDGKMTLFGFYEEHLLEIQNSRKWNEDTCLEYDNVMCEVVGPVFSEVALLDMEEYEFLDLWNRVFDRCTTERQKKFVYTIVRFLIQMARAEGQTYVFIHTDYYIESQRPGARKKSKGKTAEKKVELRGNRIPKTLSVSMEIAVLKMALEGCYEKGELIAGILMFLTDARTSEACGFLWRDLVEVRPGYWGLMRRHVKDPDEDTSEIGGKTENSYRLLWIPRFFAKLLLDRKEMLLKLFPQEQVLDMPIACTGKEYEKHANQKKVNNLMQSIFFECGCKEDMLMSLMEDLRSDPQIAADNDRSLVCYLGRHQAITEMVAIGMPEEYIPLLSGHKQIEPGTSSYDLVNPDIFVRISDYLNLRPLCRAFDLSVDYPACTYTGKSVVKESPGSLEVRFDGAKTSSAVVLIQSWEPSGKIRFEAEGVSVINEVDLPRKPDALHKEASITTEIWEYINTIKANLLSEEDSDKQEEPLQTVQPEDIGEEELPEETAPIQVLPQEVREAVSLPEKQVFRPKEPEAKPVVPPPVKRKGKKSDPKKDQIGAAASRGEQVLLSNDGKKPIIIDNDKLVPHDQAVKGKSVGIKGLHGSRLSLVKPGKRYYALRRDGQLHLLAPWSSDRSIQTEKDLIQQGAILLLQQNSDQERYPLLACLCNTGRIAVFEYGAFAVRRSNSAGRKLVKVSRGEEVISACFLGKGDDLLLISRSGKGLRLKIGSEEGLIPRVGSAAPIKGLKLVDGDEAVSAVAYRDEDLVLAKSNGLVAILNGNIKNYGINTQGVVLTKGGDVVDAFTRRENLLMLSSTGRLAVVNIRGFAAYNRGAAGVKAMKITQGSVIAAAVSDNVRPISE